MTSEIEQTALPGVGVRYSFVASSNARVSVLHHYSGRRQLFIEDADDPDASQLVLEFDDEDGRVLTELLGASTVVREIDRLRQSVAGLSLEWLRIPRDGAAAGRTIGELEIRSTTGVTVIAALRAGAAQPVPGPDFVIEAADTLVVLGQPEALRRADTLLRG